MKLIYLLIILFSFILLEPIITLIREGMETIQVETDGNIVGTFEITGLNIKPKPLKPTETPEPTSKEITGLDLPLTSTQAFDTLTQGMPNVMSSFGPNSQN